MLGINSTFEDKLSKIQKLLEKGNIEKVIKYLDRFSDDKTRFEKLSKVIERRQQSIPRDARADPALNTAAKEGNMYNAIESLMQGADVNAGDKLGSPLLKAMFNENFDVAELLIHLGADVNGHDASGDSILMDAAMGENLDIVRLLVAKGVNPFARNSHGRTAKYLAKQKERKMGNTITRQIIDLLERYEDAVIRATGGERSLLEENPDDLDADPNQPSPPEPDDLPLEETEINI